MMRSFRRDQPDLTTTMSPVAMLAPAPMVATAGLALEIAVIAEEVP
jgi:hypothetical protein